MSKPPCTDFGTGRNFFVIFTSRKLTLRYYADRIAVQGKCPRPQFMKGMVKNMKQQPEKNYWENRRNLQLAADEMLSHMIGHEW